MVKRLSYTRGKRLHPSVLLKEGRRPRNRLWTQKKWKQLAKLDIEKDLSQDPKLGGYLVRPDRKFHL